MTKLEKFQKFKLTNHEIRCYYDSKTHTWYFHLNGYKEPVANEKTIGFSEAKGKAIIQFLEVIEAVKS